MTRASQIKTYLKTVPAAIKPYSIYSLKCPNCQRINVVGAIKCWNCGYDFLAKEEKKKKTKDYSYWQIWFLIFLTAIFVAIVLWVRAI